MINDSRGIEQFKKQTFSIVEQITSIKKRLKKNPVKRDLKYKYN